MYLIYPSRCIKSDQIMQLPRVILKQVKRVHWNTIRWFTGYVYAYKLGLTMFNAKHFKLKLRYEK